MNEGEEIEMEYHPELSQVKVTNLSLKKIITLKNITDEEKDLHFVISTKKVDQEV